jgi:cobalt/nickel transport protein
MRRLYISALAVAGLVALASGHMLFAVFPEDAKEDSDVNIWITYSHDVEGETAPQLARAVVTRPDGTEGLSLAERDGGLAGTVDVGGSGCYILDYEMEPTYFDPGWIGFSGESSFLSKSGRAIMPVGTGGDCEISTGEGLEIVPQVDMTGIGRGDQFRAAALWNGEMVEGDYTAMVVKTPEDLLTVLHAYESEVEGTTGDGTIDFDLSKPGLWVVSFEATIEESGTWTATSDDPSGRYGKGDSLDYDQIAPTAYLTFWCGR